MNPPAAPAGRGRWRRGWKHCREEWRYRTIKKEKRARSGADSPKDSISNERLQMLTVKFPIEIVNLCESWCTSRAISCDQTRPGISTSYRMMTRDCLRQVVSSAPCCSVERLHRGDCVMCVLGPWSKCNAQVQSGVSMRVRWTSYRNRQVVTKEFAVDGNDLASAEVWGEGQTAVFPNKDFNLSFPKILFFFSQRLFQKGKRMWWLECTPQGCDGLWFYIGKH